MAGTNNTADLLRDGARGFENNERWKRFDSKLLAEQFPRVSVLNVSPDLGSFSFTSRRNARKLLLRGYREGLRILAEGKNRGVFEMRPPERYAGKA